jgi:hypothetical protein
MECYQCLQNGINRDAVGLCHHCSAALCSEHTCEVEDPITIKHATAPSTVLPRKARILLCATCKSALDQVRADYPEVLHA